MLKQGKTLLIILSSLIVCSCSSEQGLGENYSIDLTAKYNDNINSFRISPNGEATVLINKLNEPGMLYQVSFTEQEMDSIQHILSTVPLNNCDTVRADQSDGTQYVMNIENKSGKKKLVSNSCEQLKPLDNLVFLIIKSFRAKKKTDYYESLKTITPPPFPAQ
jgi:hypothetical protein